MSEGLALILVPLVSLTLVALFVAMGSSFSKANFRREVKNF